MWQQSDTRVLMCETVPNLLSTPKAINMSATSSPALSYNNRTFSSKSNTSNGEVGTSTLFHYHQEPNGSIVWAEYSGGMIAKGFLIATVQPGGLLDARYQHVNISGVLMTGRCLSTPERLPDGRLRLHEQWQWTSGDQSSGTSVVEEVMPGEMAR